MSLSYLGSETQRGETRPAMKKGDIQYKATGRKGKLDLHS